MYNTLPNKDGLLYLNVAETYSTKGFQAALIQYHWPFYSILIAIINKLTKLSLLNSAYLVNFIFQIVISFAFFQLAKKIYPVKNHTVGSSVAIALLMFLIFPQFNEYRHYIIRDCGFWGFSLLAILNIINFYGSHNSILSTKYAKQPTLNFSKLFNKHLILYYSCSILAFLFRGEALLITLMLPLSVIFTNYEKSIKKQLLLTIYLPVIICAIISLTIGIIAYTVSPPSEHSLWNSLYINLHFNKLDQVVETYALNHASINSSIFAQTPLNTSSAIVFFAFGLLGVFFMKLLNCLNIIYLSLILLFFKVYLSNKNQKYLQYVELNNLKIVLFCLILLLCLPLGFLYIIFVTAGRYYVLPCLLLLLFLPISIQVLIAKLKNINSYPKSKPVLATSLVVIVGLIALSGLVSTGHSKEYIKQATDWYNLSDLPRDSRTISNHPELNYLARLSVPHQDNVDLTAQNYQYILLKVKADDHATWKKIALLESEQKLIVLKTFYNERQDSIFIIKKLN